MKVKSTTKEKSDEFERPCIPEEYYTATLKEVKDIKDGEYGPRIAFVYTIDSEEVDLAITCYTKNPASKENKLGQIIIAHGVELNDEEIELDSLVGTKAKVLVENYEIDGVKASGISKVKPLD